MCVDMRVYIHLYKQDSVLQHVSFLSDGKTITFAFHLFKYKLMLYLTVNNACNIPSCLSLKCNGFFFVIFCFNNLDTLVPFFSPLKFEQI